MAAAPPRFAAALSIALRCGPFLNSNKFSSKIGSSCGSCGAAASRAGLPLCGSAQWARLRLATAAGLNSNNYVGYKRAGRISGYNHHGHDHNNWYKRAKQRDLAWAISPRTEKKTKEIRITEERTKESRTLERADRPTRTVSGPRRLRIVGCVKIFESLVHNPDLKELNELRTRIFFFLKLDNGKSGLSP